MINLEKYGDLNRIIIVIYSALIMCSIISIIFVSSNTQFYTGILFLSLITIIGYFNYYNLTKNIPLITFISILYLFFVIPRFMMIAYTPELVTFPFDNINGYLFNKGVMLFFLSSIALFSGLLIANNFQQNKNINFNVENISINRVIIIFIITICVTLYITYRGEFTPYKAGYKGIDVFQTLLITLISLDTFSLIVLPMYFSCSKRMNSSSWTVLIYLVLTVCIIHAVLNGQRSEGLRLLISLIAINLIMKKQLIFHKKKILMMFCFLVTFAIISFPLANLFRLKTIYPQIPMASYFQKNEKQELSKQELSKQELSKQELSKQELSKQELSKQEYIESNKLTYQNTISIVLNRLSIVDYAIILPFYNYNSEMLIKYTGYQHILKNTVNMILPGEPYPEASINSSRALNLIFRGKTEEQLKTSPYSSEIWSSFSLFFFYVGWFSILIHFFIGIIFQSIFYFIAKSKIRVKVILLILYSSIIPPLILFSQGIDHSVNVIFILFLQLSCYYLIYKILGSINLKCLTK